MNRPSRLVPLALLLCFGAIPCHALDGDLDCDGEVGFADFFLFADQFDAVGAADCSLVGDLDCSGRVDFTDFFRFADAFGLRGTPGAGCGVETTSFGTPRTFADILDEPRAVAWTLRDAPLADLARVSLGVAGTSDLLLAGDDGAAALTVAPGLAAAATVSTDTLLRTMLKLVTVSGGDYMLVSAKHSNFAVDVGVDGASLRLRDHRSTFLDADSAAYLTFAFTSSAGVTNLLATGRRVYSAAADGFVADAAWSARAVTVDGTAVVLGDGDGTGWSVYAAPLDQAIPFDFNPAGVERVSNAEYLPTWDGSDRLQQTIGQILPAYAAQVAAVGADDGTAAAARTMLATIESDLAAEGAALRYPAAFYEAVRSSLLARTVYVSDLFDAVVGRHTVPYVYFTDETDDGGSHHPFMVIASYGVPEGMTHLWDIPRPPGDGAPGTMYPEQKVTRNALSMAYFAKFPLRDYGEVDGLTDNEMVDDLATDAGVSERTAYSYASTSATGIALDGVVVYPSLNNTLEFAQAAGEISSLGAHSGRGLGVHYHADSFGAAVTGTDLYNRLDYEGAAHPPVVTLGFDGVAGYGRYLDGDTASAGAEVALDAWGGHRHGDYGYHYHAESIPVTVTVPGQDPVDYTVHTLPPKGAWRGRIADIPEFWDGTAPAYGGRPGTYAGVSTPPAP